MNSRIVLAGGLAVCTTALVACGGSSRSSTHRTSSTANAPTTPAVAVYRRALEATNTQLSSDASGFEECGAGFNAGGCMNWARGDLTLEHNAIARLSSTQVPPELAAENAQVIALFKRFARDDLALVHDIESSKSSPTSPTAAEINAAADIDTETTEHLFPLMRRLDPNIVLPQQ